MAAAPAVALHGDNETYDRLIEKLVACKGTPSEIDCVVLTTDEVHHIIDQSVAELQRGAALLEMNVPVNICGDTHGQFSDVLRLFNYVGWPPKQRYLFLGDYVDRGKFSVETVCLVLLFRLRYPNDFGVLRGNHETSTINRVYGFYDECRRKYTVKTWSHFQNAFNLLPVAGLVSNKIFCIHGGLSPEMNSFDELRCWPLPYEVPERGGFIADLLWADPSGDIEGFIPSHRGISYLFGEDVVHKFCADFQIDLICRAHQVVHDGCEFFASRKLMTIFSAPNYCGEFDNSGGILMVLPNLTCRIQRLKPANRARK